LQILEIELASDQGERAGPSAGATGSQARGTRNGWRLPGIEFISNDRSSGRYDFTVFLLDAQIQI
jgi:hypothetical protein